MKKSTSLINILKENYSFNISQKWDSLDDDKQETLISMVVKDPDDYLKWVGTNWDELPDEITNVLNTIQKDAYEREIGLEEGELNETIEEDNYFDIQNEVMAEFGYDYDNMDDESVEDKVNRETEKRFKERYKDSKYLDESGLLGKGMTKSAKKADIEQSDREYIIQKQKKNMEKKSLKEDDQQYSAEDVLYDFFLSINNENEDISVAETGQLLRYLDKRKWELKPIESLTEIIKGAGHVRAEKRRQQNKLVPISKENRDLEQITFPLDGILLDLGAGKISVDNAYGSIDDIINKVYDKGYEDSNKKNDNYSELDENKLNENESGDLDSLMSHLNSALKESENLNISDEYGELFDFEDLSVEIENHINNLRDLKMNMGDYDEDEDIDEVKTKPGGKSRGLITFEAIKQAVIDEYSEYDEGESGFEEEVNEANDIEELINILDGQGFNGNEAYEFIFSSIIKQGIKEATYAGKTSKTDISKDPQYNSLSSDTKKKINMDLDKGESVTLEENLKNRFKKLAGL